MTLTNNIREIEKLSGYVQAQCDDREYEHAQYTLDMLQSKVHAVRLHIDNLQKHADYAARPAGEG